MSETAIWYQRREAAANELSAKYDLAIQSPRLIRDLLTIADTYSVTDYTSFVSRLKAPQLRQLMAAIPDVTKVFALLTEIADLRKNHYQVQTSGETADLKTLNPNPRIKWGINKDVQQAQARTERQTSVTHSESRQVNLNLLFADLRQELRSLSPENVDAVIAKSSPSILQLSEIVLNSMDRDKEFLVKLKEAVTIMKKIIINYRTNNPTAANDHQVHDELQAPLAGLESAINHFIELKKVRDVRDQIKLG